MAGKRNREITKNSKAPSDNKKVNSGINEEAAAVASFTTKFVVLTKVVSAKNNADRASTKLASAEAKYDEVEKKVPKCSQVMSMIDSATRQGLSRKTNNPSKRIHKVLLLDTI